MRISLSCEANWERVGVRAKQQLNKLRCLGQKSPLRSGGDLEGDKQTKTKETFFILAHFRQKASFMAHYVKYYQGKC
jgi:hypothetical protein